MVGWLQTEKAPDLYHLGPIWLTLEPNLPSLVSPLTILTNSLMNKQQASLTPDFGAIDTCAMTTGVACRLNLRHSLTVGRRQCNSHDMKGVSEF